MSIHPSFHYRDPSAAIDFLERAFGFETKERHDNPDGTVAHCELAFGDVVVMVGTGPADLQDVPDDFHFGTYVPQAQAAAATPESA